MFVCALLLPYSDRQRIEIWEKSGQKVAEILVRKKNQKKTLI